MCKSILRHCAQCGNTVNRKPSTKRNGEKSDIIFCSRKCYDTSRAQKIIQRSPKCQTCNNKFTHPKNKKFCSHRCRAAFVAADAHKDCEVCGVSFCAIKWQVNGQSFRYIKDKTKKLCSRECLSVFMMTNEDRKLKTVHKLENHPNWKGGGSRRGFRGNDWPKIAEECRVKAGRVCQKCGMTEKDNGRRLDVNHIIPFHQWANKSKANQQSNLEALCRSCHMITEWKWKKSNQVQMTLNLVR